MCVDEPRHGRGHPPPVRIRHLLDPEPYNILSLILLRLNLHVKALVFQEGTRR